MKTVFVGPSLYGDAIELDGLDVRPPAVQGDVLAAVVDGAAVIALIDGAFEASASVWHKEILHALREGVAVVGGGSMGALRAAECAAFGMLAVGTVARRYLEGCSDDDALVAVTHGPAELGSPPLTEALVDCETTIDTMRRRGVLEPHVAERIAGLARGMFYKDRTVDALAAIACPERPAEFAALYRRHRISMKTADARAVIGVVRSLPDLRSPARPDWELSEPPLWKERLALALSRRTPAPRPS